MALCKKYDLNKNVHRTTLGTRKLKIYELEKIDYTLVVLLDDLNIFVGK